MNTIMEKLFRTASKGRVTNGELLFLRADKQIHSNVYFKKASIGAVENEIFIIFNSDRNKLKVQDGFWTGNEKSEPEILFFKDSKLLTPINEAEAKRSGAIVFSTDNIWVIQPVETCIGRYVRD